MIKSIGCRPAFTSVPAILLVAILVKRFLATQMELVQITAPLSPPVGVIARVRSAIGVKRSREAI